MELLLPENFNRNTMYDFISQTLNENLQPRSTEIVFDFSRLSFIEPVGVTVLSNLVCWLHKWGTKVFFRTRDVNYFNRWDTMWFLDDSNFFKRYTGKHLGVSPCVRPTTIPLEEVKYSDSHQWLEQTIKWLSRCLNLTPASLANIKVCFQEIFNNIADHSSENTGCVFIQHYPNKNEVRVAISDFGVGIPHNIKKVHPGYTDAQCLSRSIEHGFSTKSTPKNRGAGLDTLVYNVVNNNKGRVYIHSNHGILDCKTSPFGIFAVPENTPGFYPGTLFDIVFRTDTIENIEEDEEDFLW